MPDDLFNVTEKAWMQVQPAKSSFHATRAPGLTLLLLLSGPAVLERGGGRARDSREQREQAFSPRLLSPRRNLLLLLPAAAAAA